MKIRISRYTSSSWMQQEKERLWSTQWLLAVHTSQFQFSGDIEVVSLVGREIIVVLTKVGFKSYVNSCPHRGSQLISESCSRQRYIECPLHHWKFALTGEAIDIPEPTPKQEMRLQEVHCEKRLGFLWVSFAKKPTPIDDFLLEAVDWFENYGLEHLRCNSILHCPLQANWKTSCDLQNEVYHLQSLHPNVLGLINDTGAKFTLGTQHAHIYVPMFERSARKLSDTAIRRAREVYHSMGITKDVNKASLSLQIAMQEKRPLTLSQLTDLHIVYLFPNIQLKMRQNEILVFRHLPDATNPSRSIVTQYRLQVEPLAGPVKERTVALNDRKLGQDVIIDLQAVERQQKGLQGNSNGIMQFVKQDIIIAHVHKQLSALGLMDYD